MVVNLYTLREEAKVRPRKRKVNYRRINLYREDVSKTCITCGFAEIRGVKRFLCNENQFTVRPYHICDLYTFSASHRNYWLRKYPLGGHTPTWVSDIRNGRPRRLNPRCPSCNGRLSKLYAGKLLWYCTRCGYSRSYNPSELIERQPLQTTLAEKIAEYEVPVA